MMKRDWEWIGIWFFLTALVCGLLIYYTHRNSVDGQLQRDCIAKHGTWKAGNGDSLGTCTFPGSLDNPP